MDRWPYSLKCVSGEGVDCTIMEGIYEIDCITCEETESGEVDIDNGETGGVDTNDDYNINSAGDVDARDDVRVNYSGENYELLEVLIEICQQTTFTLYRKFLPI